MLLLARLSPALAKELDASLSAKLATCELYDDMNFVNAGSTSGTEVQVGRRKLWLLLLCD